MRVLVALAVWSIASLATAADAEVARILERFARAKPADKALAFYSLDWSPNLPAALERARSERRPIFLIVNTNITAGCNLYSGHT